MKTFIRFLTKLNKVLANGLAIAEVTEGQLISEMCFAFGVFKLTKKTTKFL